MEKATGGNLGAAGLWALLSVMLASDALCTVPPGPERDRAAITDGTVAKRVLGEDAAGENLLKPDAWRPWQKGFQHQGDVFVCDNGADASVQRGVSQTVTLNQTSPEPIVATAQSKAEGVGGSRNSDYSLYVDLVYSDGAPLWGQVDTFSVGTHDWEKAKVVIFPDKPVRSVSFHMLLRQHTGKAWFREPTLRVCPPNTPTVPSP